MKKRIICSLGVLCALVLMLAWQERPSGIPTRAEVAAMTDREATKVLAEASRQAVVETWGEPDGMLSGLYGDVYGTPAGLHIIIYYDVSLNSGPRVQAVKIGS